ncbi:MAG: DUF5672 family protein [Alphaproteobacteria bacterium]|nr:DUF5672 family protein [Alphaproteobacteria bacterium]
MARLKLHDVTLVAADCLNPRVALWSFERSLEQCEFAAAILFTDAESADSVADYAHRLAVQIVPIPKIDSREKYSNFIMRDLYSRFATEFVLITQWDSFVLSAGSWQSIFRQYDYLGARWVHYTDGLTVGNGGFSLRSRSLMAALQAEAFPPNHPEDEVICRDYRRRLEEDYDLVFAEERLADDFAAERAYPAPGHPSSFGFHGAFNLYRVLTPVQLAEFLPLLQPSSLVARDMMELLLGYCQAGRWGEARLLKSFQDRVISQAEFDSRLAFLVPSTSIRQAILRMVDSEPIV